MLGLRLLGTEMGYLALFFTHQSAGVIIHNLPLNILTNIHDCLATAYLTPWDGIEIRASTLIREEALWIIHLLRAWPSGPHYSLAQFAPMSRTQ